MEMLVFGVLAILVAGAIRRSEVFDISWRPDRGTWIAIGTALLAFGLSALLLFVPDRSATRAALQYGGIYLVCGAMIPWSYTLLIERQSPAQLGWHTLGVARGRVG